MLQDHISYQKWSLNHLYEKEKKVRLKIQPCFTPTVGGNIAVMPSGILTAYRTSLYISSKIFKKDPFMLYSVSLCNMAPPYKMYV